MHESQAPAGGAPGARMLACPRTQAAPERKGMVMQSSGSRRAARSAALTTAAVCGALYAQAVNLKPGKYEFVSTSQVTLPPEVARQVPPGYLARIQQPRTHQQCISEVDLAKVSKQLSDERQNDPSCKMTDHSIAGNKVKFALQCQHSSSHFDGTFDSVSFKAVILQTTDKGQKMTINITGRRIGDCSR